MAIWDKKTNQQKIFIDHLKQFESRHGLKPASFTALADGGVKVTIDTKEVTYKGEKVPQYSLMLQEEGDQAQDRKKAAIMLDVLMKKGWIKEEELYTEGKNPSTCAFDVGDLILAKAYPLTNMGARGR